MKISFYAKGDALVTVPGSPRMVGQNQARVGRSFDSAAAPKTAGGYPATREPFVCDADSDTGARLAKLCRRDQSLWPADKETAAFCGVPFVELAFSESESAWAPAAAKQRATGAKSTNTTGIGAE